MNDKVAAAVESLRDAPQKWNAGAGDFVCTVGLQDLQTILAELGRLSGLRMSQEFVTRVTSEDDGFPGANGSDASPIPKPWHEKAAVTLSCAMLLEAYNFGTGDGDPENHEQEISIGYLKHELGNDDPAGYYAWYTDYPEEGAIILTGDSCLAKPRPPALGELSAQLVKDWRRRELDIRMSGRPNLGVQEILLECADELEEAAREFLGKVDG